MTLEQVHDSLRAEIDSGGRAYYVVPFIEGDEDEAKSVSATAARLKKGALRGARIGTMHGRMGAAEKDRAMREFRDGAIDVLVCTTVVEVGIDVPEATIIVIVAAERYGLAQLHQLRGRVGRGEKASRCCIVASSDADEVGVAAPRDNARMHDRRGGRGGRPAAARAGRFARCATDRSAAAEIRASDSRPSHDRTRAQAG